MSESILRLSESGHLQRIYDKWLAKTACSFEGVKQDVDRLELKSFWGLFLMSGTACFIALLCYVIWMAYCFNKYGGPISKGSSLSTRFQSFLSFLNEKESKEGNQNPHKSSNSKATHDEHDGSNVGVFVNNNEPMAP